MARVSIRGVKSLGGHLACLCRGFDFYEVKKKNCILAQITQYDPWSAGTNLRSTQSDLTHRILTLFTGYAEAINAGKSVRNEDQAAFHRGVLRTMDADSRVQFTGNFFFNFRKYWRIMYYFLKIVLGDWEIPYIYYGIFDGHAGSGCAVTAANELHQVFKTEIWLQKWPKCLEISTLIVHGKTMCNFFLPFIFHFVSLKLAIFPNYTKGVFFWESEIHFSNLQISKKIYSKSLSWTWNLKFPPISVNYLFKFQAQDSDLE